MAENWLHGNKQNWGRTNKQSLEYLSEFTSTVFTPISCFLQLNTPENVTVGRNQTNEQWIISSNRDYVQELNFEFAFRSEMFVIAGSVHPSRDRQRLWLLCPLFDFQNTPLDGYRPHLTLFPEIKRCKTLSWFKEIKKTDICQKDDLFSSGLSTSGTEPSVMALVPLGVEEST